MKELMKSLEKHLGLFSSPPEEQVAEAEERAYRRFRLQPGIPMKSSTLKAQPAPSRWIWRLGVIGVTTTLVLAVVLMQPRIDAHAVITEGGLFLAAGGRPLEPGARVEAGTAVRTEHGATLKLPDGTRIELHPQSELQLEPARDGVNIRLNDGSLSVTPATEPAVPLYVQNQGMTVPVVGTVFQSTSPKESFEVISIRKRADGGGGAGPRGLTPNNAGPSPCTMQQDPKRFAVFNVTVGHLISMAYAPMQEYSRIACRYPMTEVGFLSGLPEWAQKENFDIETVIAAGPPPFVQGKCCMEQVGTERFTGMLRQLLADRFGLVLRRETKELNVYVLSVSKNGSKLTPWKEGEFGNYGATSTAGTYPGVLNYPPKHNYAPDQIVGLISGSRGSMDYIADQIRRHVGRPVLNRTGLSGDFNYEIVFAPLRPVSQIDADRIGTGRAALPVMSRPSIFEALEEDLGLELKASKENVETWVVERIERPNEN